MAEKSSLLLNYLLLFTFTFSLLFPPIFSRTHSPDSEKTTVLDVSASIQRTKHVLSFNPQPMKPTQVEEPKTVTPSSSPLSLSLHPRSSLHKPHHKDYKSLTLSRLVRDSARVNSLTTKLNFNKSHLLKPVETVIQPKDMQLPVTSGANQDSGEYFTRLGVGTPAKQYYMVIDSGSDINWLQCKPCLACYNQSDPIYNPSDSSSYRSLSCSSAQCSSLEHRTCQSNSCGYDMLYLDESQTSGSFVTETVSFRSTGSVHNVAIGCGHNNRGLFIGAAGLIGLGRGKLSLLSQVNATSFSYCLVDSDSSTSSTLEFNSARPDDSITAPLLRSTKSPTLYYVEVSGISVGGELLSIPRSVFDIDESGDGGIIIDSGTTVTRLRTEAYNSLRDAFAKLTQNLPKAKSPFDLFDTCYDLSSKRKTTIPTVAFHFVGGKTLSLHAKNYLMPVDSKGMFCLAFAPTPNPLSIIGNVMQQGTRVSYDISNSLVGFSPNKC